MGKTAYQYRAALCGEDKVDTSCQAGIMLMTNETNMIHRMKMIMGDQG